MNNNNPRYSRVNRKKMRNRSNQLLNIMIGLVVVLILVVGAYIIVGINDDNEKESVLEQEEVEESGSSENESLNEDDEMESSDNGNDDDDTSRDDDSSDQSTEVDEAAGGSDSNEEDSSVNEGTETITTVPSDEEIVKETIINSAWKPIGTVQSGAHESKYDPDHVDWDEKKKALSYATGHAEEQLIFWKIKNGGSPQKSIGIVSTRDQSEMYRVFLEWVDEKGWQPVQMDILNTLDFEY